MAATTTVYRNSLKKSYGNGLKTLGFRLLNYMEVRLAFENLKATLTAAGCTFDDIVDVTTFHTDPEQQLNDVMAVKQEIFAHPPYPNWTAVGVTWLAGFDFEIKVIARIP